MLPSAFELIKKSYALYRANMRLFLQYTLLLAIPLFFAQIFRSFFAIKYFSHFITFSSTGSLEVIHGSIPLSSLILPLLTLFIFYLFTFFGTCALIRIISDRYNNAPLQRMSVQLSSTVRIVIPALVVGVLTFLCVLGGLALVVIPGIIFSIWFYFSVYTAILDSKTGTSALRFSKMLIHERWWEVLWLLFSTTFLIVIGTMVLFGGIRFLISMLQNITGIQTSLAIFGIVLTSVADVLITPITVGVSTILYNELKKTR